MNTFLSGPTVRVTNFMASGSAAAAWVPWWEERERKACPKLGGEEVGGFGTPVVKREWLRLRPRPPEG